MQTLPAIPLPTRATTARLTFALLAAALPPLLVLWAVRLDTWTGLPAYGSRTAGASVATMGLLLILTTLVEPWIRVSTSSPTAGRLTGDLSSKGVHTFVKYPLQLGVVLLSIGLALATRSPGGLWIVSPVLALSTLALLFGYQRTAGRLTSSKPAETRLRIPTDSAERPDMWDRAFVYAKVFLPWLVLYMGIEFLGVPPDAIDGRFAWELRIPVLPWTEALYIFTYPFVMLAPLAARRKSDLRLFVVRAYWAMGLLFSLYLLLPVIAPSRPVPGEGFLHDLMHLERRWDQPVTAFPSFHVVWSCLAAALYTATWPRRAWLAWLLAVGIAVTCVTTGMHATIDIVAGFLAFALIARGRQVGSLIHRAVRRTATGGLALANRRIHVSHAGILSAAGVAIGIAGAVTLAGAASFAWLAALATVALLGASLPQQLIPQRYSLPPASDYFIAVAGVSPFAVLAAQAGAPVWLLLAAAVTGAGLAESVAGLKVLRATHPTTDAPIPTGPAGLPLALFASARALLISIVLIRLWLLNVPLSFLLGFYFILTGLSRFVEDHLRFRGETSTTPMLHRHQWFAAGMALLGIFLTMLQSPPAPEPAGFVPLAWAAAGLFGLATLTALGISRMPDSIRA